MSAPGKVYLIGAGPGDPELLTFKAARCLGQAQVVLIDALVGRGVLAHAAPDAEIVEVGKRCGFHSAAQHDIEARMLAEARAGRCVARVKGGDPFIFGRGGEEIDTLRAAGIEVEVINGITAGSAVPATLGIPLTHRHLAHGVTFVSGHSHQDGAEADWARLAQSAMTLVIYMGMNNLDHIVGRLLAGGLDAGTPAAVIEQGTLPTQRQTLASLGGLCAAAKRAGLGCPALIVIGHTVSFARADAAYIRQEELT
jgi:uroporphyrin-III C-methyltransferase